MGCAHRRHPEAEVIRPGCTHGRHSVSEPPELIQLLVPAGLLEEQHRDGLTAHVLGVLQRNAKVAGKQKPEAIKITSTSLADNQAVAGAGADEKVVNINYEVVS